MQPCSVELKEDRIVIKQPLLGSNGSPKMPRTLAIQALKSIDGIEPNELFEQIHQRNTQTLVQLIRELDAIHHGAPVNKPRERARRERVVGRLDLARPRGGAIAERQFNRVADVRARARRRGRARARTAAP